MLTDLTDGALPMICRLVDEALSFDGRLRAVDVSHDSPPCDGGRRAHAGRRLRVHANIVVYMRLNGHVPPSTARAQSQQ